MAVFTRFSDESLAAWVRIYGLGECNACTPIEAGIENSNYFLTLVADGAASDYVLTLLEDIPLDSAPFFSKLLTHLHHHGLPVAAPKTTLDGMAYTLFCGKPAFLVPRLKGIHISKPDPHHCEAIGDFLARAHHALADFDATSRFTRANPYNPDWVDQTLAATKPRVDDEATVQMAWLADLYRELQGEDLPTGYIHGDLFTDNALFEQGAPGEDRLTGVIDFYHACEDFLLQDIAVAINDWCRAADAVAVDESRKEALLKGYEAKRALTARERDLLVPMQKTSALRFALTRLLSGDPPKKDPGEMLRLASSLPPS